LTHRAIFFTSRLSYTKSFNFLFCKTLIACICLVIRKSCGEEKRVPPIRKEMTFRGFVSSLFRGSLRDRGFADGNTSRKFQPRFRSRSCSRS